MKKINISFLQKTILITICSAFINFAFIVYYAFTAIKLKDGFSIGISIYYFLLFLIKSSTLIMEKIILKKEENLKTKTRINNYKISSCAIFVLDLCLIAPIILMAINPQEVNFGTIPAIAMAAYAFYKIVVSIISYNKSKKSLNPTIILFKEVNIITAIVSILSLQHTLIMVNGGMNNDMQNLSIISSIAFIVVIILFSIISFLKNTKIFSQNLKNLK